MVLADPRQNMAFAAAYAVGVLAAAAAGRGGQSGPGDGGRPAGAAGRHLGAGHRGGCGELAGAEMDVTVKAGAFRLECDRGGMMANLSQFPVTHAAGLRLTDHGPVAVAGGDSVWPLGLLWGDAA